MNPGKVFLVGAGPGDPELLTIKAAKIIGMADVLLVDDLVGNDVLQYAGAHARIVHVGKRGGCQSTPQEFIERLMVSEAQQGHVVVRLKGGDPFVFGRGAEESAAMRDAGIECEIVNGITSGLAAPTSLGIPLTHRDVCQGAILVTGHAGESRYGEGGGGTGPNWRALVATALPLVIYMGISRCEKIQRELIDAGMACSMPVAVIKNASRADEQSLITTLASMAAHIRAARIESPAIIVVGETVRYARLPAETALGLGHAAQAARASGLI
ncbi:MAG: uroporphyrinogen-III C-methyltransferase [Usitatibacteraceae bacterium]